MLDGLDTVAWPELGHAYGPADDLPQLLRDAASDDADRRAEAVYELFGTVWHQGTVYSATPYAVPFIAELAERGAGVRSEMLQLLACIVQGEAHNDPDAVEAGRRAVFALLPSLFAFARDTDQGVRRTWLRLMAACGPAAEAALPLLREALRTEPEAEVRAEVVAVLAAVDPSPASTEERNRLLSRDPAVEVRLAALTEIVRATPVPYPEELVADVVDACVALPHQTVARLSEDQASLEELLVLDADAALAATGRAAAAGSRWSLASQVDAEWRDREADVLPWYFAELHAHRDERRETVVLYEIARAALAVPRLDAAYIDVLTRYAADDTRPEPQAAAVTALARAGVETAIERCVHLVRACPDEWGARRTVAAVVESLADRAEPVALAIAERLRHAVRGATRGVRDLDGGHILALRDFPVVAEAVVDDLAALVRGGIHTTPAARVLEALGPRARAAAPALLEAANGSDDFHADLAAASAHFRVTGDPAVALGVFERGLGTRHRSHVYRWVGELGVSAAPLLSHLEAGLRDTLGWARVGAAEAIWRVTGRFEDTVPLIASELRGAETMYAAAQASATRALTRMRLVPEALVPTLRAFADSERRRVPDGAYDGTPHDDNVARDAVRHLLDTAEVTPLPVAPPVVVEYDWEAA